jgi:hypothetical protein
MSAQLHPLQESSEREWLELFPGSRRSQVATWFHGGVRAGISHAPDLLTHVSMTAKRMLGFPWWDSGDREHFLGVLSALEPPYRECALRYAAHVVAYERLPLEERERIKDARTARFRQEWIEHQPPTDKQLAFLRSLGCSEIPASRAETSRWIDARKGGAGR